MASAPFDERLTRLSRRERTAFVGALLAARGWEVTVDSPLVRARNADQRQVVAVAPEGFVSSLGRTLPQTPVDVVVGVDTDRTQRLADAHDADAWDARTLYDMARHGLDADATDRLFEAYFGTTSATVDPPFTADATSATNSEPDDQSERPPRPQPDASDADAPTDDSPTGLRRWDVPLLVVVLLVALFGGAIATQALVGVSPSDDAATDLDTGSGTGAENGRPSEPVSTTPEPQQLIPGLTDAGIADTAVISQGHATALDERSFTMRITYTERIDGETVGTAREVVRVENATVYRSTGTESGDLEADLIPVIVRDLYADGEGRYLRKGDEYIRVGDANESRTGQVVERSRALVVWYLSATRSSFSERIQQGEVTYYRVAVEGTTDRRFSDYRATGLVSEQGLVVRVEATYRFPENDRVATVSIRHVNVGNTTVDRPEWLPPANESSSSSTST